MFFKKLIEQHRVHRVVAYGVDLAVLVADYQVRIYLSYVLSNQPKLRSVCSCALVVKCHWLQRKNSFAGLVHRFNLFLEPARGTGRAELAGGVDQHRYCVAVSRCHPVNVADADNVIRRGDGRARSTAQGRIIVSSAVTTERLGATGRVIAASGVVKERSSAVSRIKVSGGVQLECSKTGSRIFLAGGVGRQRVRAEGAVVGAIGIAQQRTISKGRVAASITSSAYVIQEKRAITGSGVLVTVLVGGKGESARGGIGIAIDVAEQRLVTRSGITVSGSEEIERSKTEA